MSTDPRRSGSLFAALGTMMLLGAGTAPAQCTPGGPPSPPAVKRAMVGIVMDTAHRVLEGVDVLIRDPRRNVKTDARGRFVIDDLAPGDNEMTVRKLGYEIAVQTITVTDSGGVARFCLIPETRALPAIITSAKRTGLGGVVGDSTYAVLPGAQVRVLAANANATTDSTGGFFIPLAKGVYAVQVSKKGFGTQLFSVTIPADSGREVAVWLSSPPRNKNRMAANYDDLRMRLAMRTSFNSSVLSGEDLARTSADFPQTVQQAARMPIDTDCEAIVDGGPWTLPFGLIDKNDLAFVEVYKNPPTAPRGVTSMDSRGTRAPAGPSTNCKFTVFVWFKP